MCDSSDACCVSSPLGKAGCVAKGGSPSSDPCNILNPLASTSGCVASKAAKSAQDSGKSDQLGVGLIIMMVIAILVMLVILFFVMSRSTSVGGGSRKFTSVFKRFFK